MSQTDWAPYKTGFKVEDMKLRMDQTFNRRPSLKAAYQDLELTPEQELEFVKCAMDAEYFIRNYYRITTIDRGFVLFEPHPYQVEIIKAFQENRFNIICQCRQSGKTTIVAAILLWYALFHSDKEIALLSNKEAASKEILDRINKALMDMPFFLQQGVTKFGSLGVAFENGSKIGAYATSSDGIRGRSIACLYIDEFAFVQGDEEFWESVFPTIASAESSKCVLTSTPKGQRGMFYNIWQGADPDENGKTNGFHKTLVTWEDCPAYNSKEGWEEETRKRLGDSRFDQEFGCSFKGSVGTLIPSKFLMAMHSKKLADEPNEYTKILYPYNPEHRYVGVADVGGGLEQDYSVYTVFDVTEYPYKIAAKYRCNTISPLLYPYTVVDISQAYGNCPVLMETNNDVGGQAITVLWYDLEYEETILTSSDAKRGGSGLRIGGRQAKPGVKTTSRVRNIGCSNLKALIETGKLVIEDLDTIDELGTFVLANDRYEADEGCHDDCVMTLVLFSWLVKQDWFVDEYDRNVSSDMFKSASQRAVEEMMPFGGVGGASPSHTENVTNYGNVVVRQGSTSGMESWMND